MTTTYLLAGQTAELDRLTAQARIWEPAGRAVLDCIPGSDGLRVLDVGCGALGWLRILADWVGPSGTVVGSDIDPAMLDAARASADAAALGNVELVQDDLFASELRAGSFDLVHARFQLAPIGRVEEQLSAFRRWLKPGGWLVLEDPDPSTWRCEPEAPATARLIAAIEAAFGGGGGSFSAGVQLPAYLSSLGIDPRVRRTVLDLDHDEPYLRLPLQFATSLEGRLVDAIGEPALADLRAAATAELDAPDRRGTSFTLVSAWGRLPG